MFAIFIRDPKKKRFGKKSAIKMVPRRNFAVYFTLSFDEADC